MFYVTFFAAVLAVAALCASIAVLLGVESFARRLIAGRGGTSRLWTLASRWPPVTVLLLAVCAAALTPVFRGLLIAATTAEARGSSGRQAAKVMYLHYLPEDAEDVNYSVRFNMALADFRIGQSEFLRWCQSRNCQLIQIGQPPHEQPVRVRHGSLKGEHELLVTDGLVCQIEPQQRQTVRIVFDRQGSRAYYEFRAW
jgi:hypothetical protein